MFDRRHFLTSSLVGGVSLLRLEGAFADARDAGLAFRLSRDVPTRMYAWGPNYILPIQNMYGSDGSVYVARIHWSKSNRNP